MGSRPAKASDTSGKGSGPNGSEGDAQASTPDSGNAGQPPSQQQQQEPEEVLQLRSTLERMESQVAALKEELNKEIELNSELRTEVSRRQQYDYIALGAAVVAAIGAVLLFQRRR